MKKIVMLAAAAAALAVPVAASASPSFSTPANGKCVAAGVQTLGGSTISIAANGTYIPGVNAVPIVIQAHLDGVGLVSGVVCS